MAVQPPDPDTSVSTVEDTTTFVTTTSTAVIPALVALFSKPRVFFRDLRHQGSWTTSALFLVSMGAFAGLMGTIKGLATENSNFLSNPIHAISFLIGHLVTSTLMVCFLAAAESLLIFLVCKWMKAPTPYTSIFKVRGYGAASLAIAWIPLMGWPAAIYSLVLLVFGMKLSLGIPADKTTRIIVAVVVIGFILRMPLSLLH